MNMDIIVLIDLKAINENVRVYFRIPDWLFAGASYI